MERAGQVLGDRVVATRRQMGAMRGVACRGILTRAPRLRSTHHHDER
jgi:hypothetical protein